MSERIAKLEFEVQHLTVMVLTQQKELKLIKRIALGAVLSLLLVGGQLSKEDAIAVGKLALKIGLL